MNALIAPSVAPAEIRLINSRALVPLDSVAASVIETLWDLSVNVVRNLSTLAAESMKEEILTVVCRPFGSI